MNIHLIPDEKFTHKFVDFVKGSFPPGENIVYIYNVKPNSEDAYGSYCGLVTITGSL